MPPPEDDRRLAPIPQVLARDIPRAGQLELARFRQDREDTLISFLVRFFLGVVSAATMIALLPSGVGAYALFLLLSSIFLGGAGVKFLKLAGGKKSWAALPDGANETTAQLEDALTKAVREWNGSAAAWNEKLELLDLDVELWDIRSREPSRHEDGWSPESHAVEMDILLARGRALTAEREALMGRHLKIRRAIAALNASVRRDEGVIRTLDQDRIAQESQDDPEDD